MEERCIGIKEGTNIMDRETDFSPYSTKSAKLLYGVKLTAVLDREHRCRTLELLCSAQLVWFNMLHKCEHIFVLSKIDTDKSTVR